MAIPCLYRRFAPLLLPAAGLLGGCCANDVCDVDDSKADAIELRFSTDTLSTASNGFKVADLDTLILKRYPLPLVKQSKYDSVVLYRRPAEAREPLLLNNNTPFAQASTTKLDAYRYEVQYLAHPPRKGGPTTILVIEQVQLAGRYEASACCSYYVNSRKMLFGQTSRGPVQVDLKQAPQFLELTK